MGRKHLFEIKSTPQLLHGRKLYIDPKWQNEIADLGLASGIDWLKLKPGEVVRKGNRVIVYKVPLKNGHTVYFKTYSQRGKYIHRFMRPSQCAKEVNSYQMMADMGIPTIKPVAFGEHRTFGVLRSCFIVTIGIDETMDLEQFAFQVWQHLNLDERKKAFDQIVSETLKFIRISHQHNFFHYDLKWRNILVAKKDGNYKTYWIDCPRGRTMKLKFRSEKGCIVDLSSLARDALPYLTKTQRYRFVVQYLGESTGRKRVHKLMKKVNRHLSRRPPVSIKPIALSKN